MKLAFLALFSLAVAAQENIFLHGPGIQTVKVWNLQPGGNAAGIEFVSGDTLINGALHSTVRIYGVFDAPVFDAARLTIQTRGPGGLWVDAVTIRHGQVEVTGALKAATVAAANGVTLNCPNGMKITQVSGGIVTGAACN